MSEAKMELNDWLDDLCVRFIVNLPSEELESVERICFQVEEAQWFYEDFIRPMDPSLPSMNLRTFCLRIFQHCPGLSAFDQAVYSRAFQEFLAYKTRVPVRGAIMLNERMDSVVLVKGWKKGASWSFPRGKINKAEKDLDCAIREAYEETGFDVRAAGLVKDEAEMKFIEVSMREQHMRLYVFRGVPEDAEFEPQTRKEISKIQWYKLSELPAFHKKNKHGSGNGDDLIRAGKFYMVAPFIVPLKKWIAQQRRQEAGKDNQQALVEQGVATQEQEFMEDGPAGQLVQGGGEEAASSDMERLLAGLRQSKQGPFPSVAQEVTGDYPPPSDPAADLKRLLSIGATSTNDAQATHSKQPTKSETLLAMLRGDRSTIGPNPAQRTQTPMEQTNRIPVEPRSPHHHHAQQHLYATTSPPPRFPLSNQNAPLNAAPAIQRPQYPNIPSGPPGGSSRPNMPDPPQAERPYQRTGDPNFRLSAQFPQMQAPTSAIPSASQLPPPKLTPHAMNLLSAFKGGLAPSATATSGQTPPVQAGPPQHQPLNSRPVIPVSAPQMLPASLPYRKPSLPISPPPPTMSQTRSPPPIPVLAPKPRSAHHDALLNLFRGPSTSHVPPVPPPMTPKSGLAPEPVELAAFPSPAVGISHQLEAQAQRAQENVPLPMALDTIEPLEQKARPHAGEVSATVPGPLNMPEFQAARQLHKHTHATPVRFAPDAELSAGPKNPPIPLSSRPTQPTNIIQRNPGLSARQTDLLGLFQTQPKPQVAAVPAGQPNAVTSDRHETPAGDQKSSLLALFGKAPAANISQEFQNAAKLQDELGSHAAMQAGDRAAASGGMQATFKERYRQTADMQDGNRQIVGIEQRVLQPHSTIGRSTQASQPPLQEATNKPDANSRLNSPTLMEMNAGSRISPVSATFPPSANTANVTTAPSSAFSYHQSQSSLTASPTAKAFTNAEHALTRSSRIGSVTSLGEGKAGPAGMGTGTPGATGTGSGARTPATPIDKSFLIGFLDGFVKSASANQPRR